MAQYVIPGVTRLLIGEEGWHSQSLILERRVGLRMVEAENFFASLFLRRFRLSEYWRAQRWYKLSKKRALVSRWFALVLWITAW